MPCNEHDENQALLRLDVRSDESGPGRNPRLLNGRHVTRRRLR